jgi:hypothetical protein
MTENDTTATTDPARRNTGRGHDGTPATPASATSSPACTGCPNRSRSSRTSSRPSPGTQAQLIDASQVHPVEHDPDTAAVKPHQLLQDLPSKVTIPPTPERSDPHARPRHPAPPSPHLRHPHQTCAWRHRRCPFRRRPGHRACPLGQRLHPRPDLLDNLQDAYRRTTDHGRRLLNQAIFEKLYIGRHGITSDVLHEPFRSLKAAQQHHQQADHATATGRAKAASELAAFQPGYTSNAPLLAGLQPAGGSNKPLEVELRRIELLTSSMPWKRSTN